MEGDVLTIYSNVTQGSSAVILHIGVRRVEKSDQNGDGTRIYKLLSVLVWIRMQSVSREPRSDVITHLSVSCLAGHRLRCVELACPSNERGA